MHSLMHFVFYEAPAVCLSLATKTVKTWAVPLRGLWSGDSRIKGKIPGKMEEPPDAFVLPITRILGHKELGLGSSHRG